jgi:hypothetical protein
MRLLTLLLLLAIVAGLYIATSASAISLGILVFALAAFVGFVELLVRFRDEPFIAVISLPGTAYLGINGASATAIYFLIRYLEINFGAPLDSHLLHVMQVTIAAFSGIAFLRSGFFVGKDKETGENMMYGPALVLENVLSVVSTQVDRDRAIQRIHFSDVLSVNLKLEQAQAMLGVLIASVQTMPSVQAAGINTTAASIGGNASLQENTKVKMLLLLYLTQFGERAVDAAIPRDRGNGAVEARNALG